MSTKTSITTTTTITTTVANEISISGKSKTVKVAKSAPKTGKVKVPKVKPVPAAAASVQYCGTDRVSGNFLSREIGIEGKAAKVNNICYIDE